MVVKEWNFVRVIACLSIVLLHSSTSVGRIFGYSELFDLHFIRILLCYATPTFIILSEIILANKYSTSIPDGFFKKRIKWILGPFVAFALIDALIVSYMRSNPDYIFDKLMNNLQGHFIGYFLLVIFQFYVLHFLVVRYQIKIEKLIFMGTVLMISSLWLLNEEIYLFEGSSSIQMISFPTWLGYFVIAFLIGKHYEKLRPHLIVHRGLILVGLLFSIMLIYASYQAGYTDVSSRRLDIMPFTLFVTLTLLSIGSSLPHMKLVDLISKYSFGIFLLHWQVQRIITPIIFERTSLSSLTFIAIVFLASIVISMAIVKIVSYVPGSSYVIGKIRNAPKSKKYESEALSRKAS
ncbi:acyltransferase family protein [Exiguobacterium sp. SH3S2]|uniref:acyltransferase family protein n=1 Tax=Exiguobacterium sp. SH3S2 TaxID=2510956 RepID=UPI001375EF0E|nr:acyltransferase family protein [Exiguobacterium sp. SH3S2]